LVKKKKTAALMANAATMMSTGARLLPDGRGRTDFMIEGETNSRSMELATTAYSVARRFSEHSVALLTEELPTLSAVLSSTKHVVYERNGAL
jgi:hypothetical protein